MSCRTSESRQRPRRRQAEERDDDKGQPTLLPRPEGELAGSFPPRLPDDNPRRSPLAGGHTGAGNDRIPRRPHRSSRRVQRRRARVQTRPARRPAHARRQQELLLRHRPEQSRCLYAYIGS